MTATQRQLAFACGLAPTLLAAWLAILRPPALAHVEFDAYDTVVRATAATPPTQRVIVVDVDERSLSSIGQWPWRRDVMARLLGRLRDLGARAIGVDVIFAEPDRSTGPDLAPDAVLADTLRGGGVVLGYATRFEPEASPSGTCVRHPLGLSVISPSSYDGSPLFHATGATCSLPLLNQAAGRSGFLNAVPDSDGVLRRLPVLIDVNGQAFPSLALATIAMAEQLDHSVLEVANAHASTLTLGGRRVPLDGQGNLLVRYRGAKHSFPYLSAVDVLQGRVSPRDVEGRIVFVGTTALGTREVVATPLDTLFTGVEVQATVADNLLAGDFAGRPSYGAALEAGLVLAMGLLATWLVLRVGPSLGGTCALVGVAMLWAGTAWALKARGVYISPLYPTMAVVGAAATMTLTRVSFEKRRADTAGQARTASQRLMVQSLLSLTGIRDADTGRHSSRTEGYVRVLAGQLAQHPDYAAELTPAHIELFASLAPLHDIGKVGVPDAVLNKPGELTPDEQLEMRRHPEYGRNVILQAEREAGVLDDAVLALAKDIVYTHHEKWDGSGYPRGLRGPEIPVVGRVMALVDVWDAIRTTRRYHTAMTTDQAIAFIRKGRGTHFDPAVVDAFDKVAGAMEELSLLDQQQSRYDAGSMRKTAPSFSSVRT